MKRTDSFFGRWLEKLTSARQRDDFLEKVLQTSPSAIAVLDRRGRVVYANVQVERILGLSREKIIQRVFDAAEWPITDAEGNPVPPENRLLERVRAGRQPVFDEVRAFQRPDGEQVVLSLNAAPLFDQRGDFDGLVVSMEDITDRRRAEEAARHTRQRLQTLIDSFPFGAHEYELLPDGRLILVGANRSADRILGIQHGPLIGRTIEEAFPALATTSLPEAYRAVARGGESFHETQIEYQDERIAGAFDVFATQTAPNRMVVFFRDVTERKRAEDELRESQQMLRLILDTIPVRVFWKDQNLNYLGANRPFARDAGLQSPDELIGKNDYQMGWAPQAELYRADDLEVIRSGQPKINYEEPQTTPSGDLIWLRTSKVPLVDARGRVRGVLGTYEDITDQKRASQDLNRRLKELTVLHMAATIGVEAATIDELIERLTRLIGETLYPDSFGIALLDEKRQGLVPHSSYHHVVPVVNVPSFIPLGEGIAGIVAATGRPILEADVLQSNYYIGYDPTTRSELCVPIKIGERVLGIINAESSQVGFFSENDERLLATLASQLAVSIEKIRLLEAERQRRQEAETLRKAAEIIASSLDLTTVLDSILDALRQVVPYNSASIFLQEGEVLRLTTVHGFEQPEAIVGMTFPASNELIRKINKTRRPLILPDAQRDSRYKKWGGAASVRGWMGVPLLLRDEVIGYITLDHQQPNAYSQEDAALVQTFARQAAIALDNARLYQQALRASERSAVLHQASQEIASASQDPEQVYEAVHRATSRLMPAEAFVITLLDESHQDAEAVYLVDKGGRWPGLRFPLDRSLSGQVITTGRSLLIADLQEHKQTPGIHFGESEEVRSILAVPLQFGGRIIGMLSTQSYQPDAYTEEDKTLLEMLAAHATVAIENARLYAETLQRLKELEAINRISNILRLAESVEEILPRLLDETLELMGSGSGSIELYDPLTADLTSSVTRGWLAQIPATKMKPGEGIAGLAFKSGEPIIVREFVADPRLDEEARIHIPPGWGGICVPIRTAQTVIGVIFVSVRLPRQMNRDEANLLVTLADIAGTALHRATLHQQTRRQLQRLASLRAIDMAISSILDVRVTLGILLDHITAQLNVDAVDVLLLNPRAQTLEFAASSGFRTEAIQRSNLHMNEELPGLVLQQRKIVQIPDLSAAEQFKRRQLLAGEAFVSYIGAPLVAKGQTKGVIEIFHRTHLEPDSEWLSFLETLAGQAAIAIDNASLFEELQRTNLDLSLAYDATIEGWSKALDLRDRETEGHTRRVVEMTLELARAMGIPDDELVHIRRGALLHDIGKMGIPDAILHKTGALNKQEWEIMRQHPTFAYEMLYPISYLRLALNIPYCHHERWDGSGYPRGLKGEQIPLAARIFAVVDVWDALTSDRPYRKAWTTEAAIAYLKENAGKQFDPRIVERFLKLLEEKNRGLTGEH
ncbi:MAG: GAF domain-containing protein [Anaerolineales bacterium]